MQIAKESIFTGLNNFKVCSISDLGYAEYFGFTDNEVREMLRYYGVEERFPDMKEWYDGYHFGEADVYCPWDVIVQCDKFRRSADAQMEPHWENSSSNTIVRDILKDATGYLTDMGKPNGRIHKLAIPNKEIRGIYEDRVRSWFCEKVMSNPDLRVCV